MANPTIHRLGDLQLKIMKALWDASEATVTQVRETVSPDARLAHSTIATMLRKMEARGLVKHRLLERRFLYRALVKEAEVASKMSEHFIEGLFEGSDLLVEYGEILARSVDAGLDLPPLGLDARSTKTEAD